MTWAPFDRALSLGLRAGRILALVGAVFALLFSPRLEAAPKTGKPWLGIAMESGPGGGVFVDVVFRSSPADQANLEEGDMIVSVDGVELDEPRELVALVRQRKPGMTLAVIYRRGGRQKKVSVELAEHPGNDEVMRLMHAGRQAPDPGALAQVKGKVPTRMKELRGEVVLVDFFASWCTGCKALAPTLATWHRKRDDKGLTIIGVSSDSADVAGKTVEDWKIPYAVASDAGESLRRSYKVSAIPAVFLVDKKGVIRDVMIGYDPGRLAAFEKKIDELLAK